MKNSLLFILLLGFLTSCNMENSFKPTLSKIRVAETTAFTVTLECDVVEDLDYSVTERGINWGTSLPLDIDNTFKKPFDDNKTGSFLFTVENLNLSTTYYFRIYEITKNGIQYSDVDSTTTYSGRPLLFLNIWDIIGYSNKAQVSAFVYSVGEAPITRRGFCWNKTGEPTVADEMVLVSPDESGRHELFYADIQPFDSDIDYFISAFAENEFGISYSNSMMHISSNEVSPAVITLDPIIKEDGSVIFGGTVVYLGDSDIIRISLEYTEGTSGNPTSIERIVSASEIPYTFQMNPITDLKGGTIYYVRASASNFNGKSGRGNTKILYIPTLADY